MDSQTKDILTHRLHQAHEFRTYAGEIISYIESLENKITQLQKQVQTLEQAPRYINKQ